MARPDMNALQVLGLSDTPDSGDHHGNQDEQEKRAMYLYRTRDGRIVAVEQDIHDSVDKSGFKAPIIGGRPMDRGAAMGLLRQFGGVVITAEGSEQVSPKAA